MAKVGLAAELAKQAAQAAREEVAQSEAAANPVAKGRGNPAWNVPKLPEDFDLTQAVDRAAGFVVSYYQKALEPEGMSVGWEDMSGSDAKTQQVVEQAQEPGVVAVREQTTGRLVRTYAPSDLLSMYAAQRQATGVVVDGQV
jgi:hypothetical protein